MLRFASVALSSLRIGERLKEMAAAAVKQAAIVAAAGVLLLAAAVFGLVASYHALTAYGFSPSEAATLVAIVLAVVALLVLLIGPRLVEQRDENPPSSLPSLKASTNLVEQGVGKAMHQVGPLTLLSIAFVGGLLAGRFR